MAALAARGVKVAVVVVAAAEEEQAALEATYRRALGVLGAPAGSGAAAGVDLTAALGAVRATTGVPLSATAVVASNPRAAKAAAGAGAGVAEVALGGVDAEAIERAVRRFGEGEGDLKGY